MKTEARMLPYDFCRCDDETCEKKDDCRRYRDRDKIGYRTPFFVGGCGPERASFDPSMVEVTP